MVVFFVLGSSHADLVGEHDFGYPPGRRLA